jgi:hypothetical protein
VASLIESVFAMPRTYPLVDKLSMHKSSRCENPSPISFNHLSINCEQVAFFALTWLLQWTVNTGKKDAQRRILTPKLIAEVAACIELQKAW